ncbi:hypothetical protein DFJ58DRAFT_759950 [Suillus subalutaceus]|uniref:uncharacterized protein n=1 Tax=Suillus subalutaceus TaxID=48586 RepID=UPI001B881228|nr:uncharacterized protein DFJ58DRAFT_759950 [Suillus subalutaceus]KAG1873740.1 hypothetical protein DFJ58DRAFT_759950 [Suillus subalutaceus]
MQSIPPKPASASLTSLNNVDTSPGIFSTKMTLQIGLPRSVKGKKRARDSSPSSSSLSSAHSEAPVIAPPVKKPKRAETRQCPACAELIPVRLLATHAALEMQRVEDIIRHIGEAEVLAEVDDLGEGPSNRARRSALKARKHLTTSIPSSTSPSAVDKTIQIITRRRKARHLRLKELAKEHETVSWVMEVEGGTSCPVCAQVVRGDRDVVEAHVDACLTHESTRLEQERLRDEEEDIHIGGVGGSIRTRVITSASLRGTGIHIRTSNSLDIEDEVDIDGEDEAVFGEAQFGEADVLALPSSDRDLHPENEDNDVDIDGHIGTAQERQTLRHLIVEGKVLMKTDSIEGKVIQPIEIEQLDLDIITARSRNDPSALILALENKLKALESNAGSTSSLNLCRICLSQYTDPTVSTGCWHTCCRECWLRCLGATKLCPMCQRITSAAELRRVYM